GRQQVAQRLRAGSPVAAVLVGMTFALWWTPCAGPTLTFILLRASVPHARAGGTALMLLYCAGLALPFLLVALLFERAQPLVRALNQRARGVEFASGLRLVLVG